MNALIIVSALVAVASASPALLGPAVFAAQSQVRSQYHSQDGLGQYNYGYNGDLSAKVESRSLDGVTRGSYNYVDANGQLQTVEYTADDQNGFRALATNLPRAPIDNQIVPEPVRETPEVAQARAEHIRAYNEAALRAAAAPEYPHQIAAVPQFAPAPAVFAVRAPAPVLAFRETPNSFSYSTNINGGALTVPALPRAHLFASALQPAPIAYTSNSELPLDTPEVAHAKALHFQAVEEQKARIASASH
jgi:hypothetical protein